MPDKKTIAAGKTGSPTAMTSRRQAIGAVGTAVAATMAGTAMSVAGAQARTAAAPSILHMAPPPPLEVPEAGLVSALQYEDQARLVLGAEKVAPILGSDRTITDRITLRPRINIPTQDMDLTCTLFGDQHFTPILVGPMAYQKRFHADGEVATARGASQARAGIIVSSNSSVPLATIAKALTTPLWLQVYAKGPKVKDTLAEAVAAKAKAVVVTVNAGTSADAPAASTSAIDWTGVDAVIKGTPLPVIVKGIVRPQDAKEAVARGAKGVVVSNYRGGNEAALPSPLLLIEPVVQAVGGRVPVLADGSLRYGTDILKALGFGAKAVLIGRPVMWGLAAYGDAGVQGVVQWLQTDLARYMAMCCRPTLATVNSSVVWVHAPLPKATAL